MALGSTGTGVVISASARPRSGTSAGGRQAVEDARGAAVYGARVGTESPAQPTNVPIVMRTTRPVRERDENRWHAKRGRERRCFSMRGMSRVATAAAFVLCGAGCDPLLNVEGSFFPAWMLCIVLGIALTVAMRYLFVLLRLEPHLGPSVLIYPSLALLLTVLTWLALYRS